MKKSMNTIGRMTAMLLAFIMIISMGQSSVYASGSGPQTFVFSGKNADDEQEADAVEAADGGETTEADAAQELTEQSVEASITAEPTLQGRLKAFGRNAMRFFSIGNADEPEIVLSGLLPEGAVVNAYPVSVEIPGQNVLVAYDISISVPVLDENGEAAGEMTEWQPDESLSVSIRDTSLDNASDVEIYHMEDASAEPEMIDITTADNGVVSFMADSFSIYVVVEEDPKPQVEYVFHPYGNSEEDKFSVFVTEDDYLLEPTTPANPDMGMFVGWYWDPEFSEHIDFTDKDPSNPNDHSRLKATDAPRTVNIYGQFDGKHYLKFMSLPMEGGGRRTFETVVLDPSVTEYELKDVNTYGAPAGYKFRGWATSVDNADPYNDELMHDAASPETSYYTLTEKITGISGSMTLYPVVKTAYSITFNADPANQGGLIDGKKTKVILAANDETWEEIGQQYDTVEAPGYTFDGWYKGYSDGAYSDPIDLEGNKNTINEANQTLYAKWSAEDDVNVTFMYWKEDVTPELYTLMETQTRTYSAGASIDLTTLLSENEALIAPGGRLVQSDADMEYFYLAEITGGDGTTDSEKWDDAVHSQYTTVKGDGSTVVNVWYDRKVVRLEFCGTNINTVERTTLVRLGEPLADVWPDGAAYELYNNVGGQSLNALYIYPAASAPVLKGLTNTGGIVSNVTSLSNYKEIAHSGYTSYYPDVKDKYQAVKKLKKLSGTPQNLAYHWYEKTNTEASANSINYSSATAPNNPDNIFKTTAGSIVTREVDGYRIDYDKTRAQMGSNNVSVSSRYADNQPKQLGVKYKTARVTYEGRTGNRNVFYVYYKANKYAINLFDGDRLLARNTEIKYNTPLNSGWVKINGHTLDELLAVEPYSTGSPSMIATAEAEALARTIYGRNAPPSYMRFVGWYIDRDFAATDNPLDVSGGMTMPSADLNLYARWEPRYVEVEVNKGTTSGQKQYPHSFDFAALPGTQYLYYETSSNMGEDYRPDYGYKAHENTLADYLPDGWMNPTWHNHVFLGWEYSTDGGTTWKTVTNWNDPVDVDTKLRGNWQDMTPFSVHYYVDSHEVKLDAATYLNGGAVILKGYDKTNSAGQVFHGWKLRGDEDPDRIHAPGDTLFVHGGDLYLDGVFETGSVNPGENPALYVFMVWEPNGTTDSSTTDWADDEGQEPRRIEKFPNYTLPGYYGSTDNTGGKWKVFYQEIIWAGDELTMPTEIPDPVVEGGQTLEFQGWYENPGLTKRFEGYGVINNPHSTVVYAGFKTPWKVTYHTIDGQRTLSVQTYAWDGTDRLDTGTVGEKYTYSDAASGKHYKLVKWTDYNVHGQPMSEADVLAADPNAKIFEKNRVSAVTVTKDMDLYPIMVEGYTLYFDTDGGSYIPPEVYLIDEPTEAPEPPTKGAAGEFEFKGWFKHDTCLEGDEFFWGGTLTDDTTAYGKFVGENDKKQINPAIWLQNADGETYSHADTIVVASDQGLQDVNTVFTLDASHISSLTTDASSPVSTIINNTVGADCWQYFEYVTVPASDTNVGTNESVMVTKGENVLNLYYARKRYTLTFNAVNGSNAGQVKGDDTYSLDIWLGRDVTDLWPRADEVVPGDGNTAFNVWSGNGNTVRYEPEITRDLLTMLGNSDCTLTANYVSTVPVTTQPTYVNNVSTPDATYSVVIEHHLLDDAVNPTSDKIISKKVDQVDWSTYLSTYRTKFSVDSSDQYTVPAKADIETAWALTDPKYTLLTTRTEASNSSIEVSGYEYRHEFRPAGNPRSEAYFGRVVFETDNAIGSIDNGFYFYDQLEVKENWERVEDHNLYNNGVAHTGSVKFMYADRSGNSRYNYYNGRRYAHSLSSNNNGDYDDYALSYFTTFPNSFSTVTGNASNGYATHSRQNNYVIEYRRNYTDYTGGTIAIKFYYTKDTTVSSHTVTRNYGDNATASTVKVLDGTGAETSEDREYALGETVALADLGTPDPADHAADIQALMGSDYDANATYHFTGWYTTSDRTSKVPSVGLVMPNRNITVYAGWADASASTEDEVTVTTLVNGTRTNFTRESGTPFGSFNIPTSMAADEMNQNGHTGDVLLGWYLDGDPYQVLIQPTEPIKQDITVRPLIMHADDSFNVIYDLNGGTAKGDPNQQGRNPVPGTAPQAGGVQYATTDNYFPGAEVTVAAVDSGNLNMPRGYAQFYRWNTKADGTGDVYYPMDTVTIPPDGDLKLYAEYSPSMETHLIYNLGYTNDYEQDVKFYDYRDTNRGSKLYTNSTYSLGTENDGQAEPAKLQFNNTTVELVRPGWTFKGWLDETLLADYDAADDDGKAAMLLHNGDNIRITAPEIDANGDPIPNRLIAQWEKDVLLIDVYVCDNGKWKNPTEKVVDDGEYAPDTIAADDILTPDTTFARSYYTPADPYAHYEYSMAAVGNDVITSLTYQAKADGSGYAWTYTRAGATAAVELGKDEPLKLYFTPEQAQINVHYRVVERGVYKETTTDNIDVRTIAGLEAADPIDIEDQTAIDNTTSVDLQTAYVNGHPGTGDYEILGVFYSSDGTFDRSKEIPEDLRNIYYVDGQAHTGNANGFTGGKAIDSSDIYIAYYNKNYALVEARYVAVETDEETSEETRTLLDGVTYVDVLKGGENGLLLNASEYTAPEGYTVYDFGYGTLKVDDYGAVVLDTVKDTEAKKLTADSDTTDVYIHLVSPDDQGTPLAAEDDLFILCYQDPREIPAYVFVDDWNGRPAYDHKATLEITSQGIALKDQQLMRPADEYTLLDIFYLEDDGGSLSETRTPEDSVLEDSAVNGKPGVKLVSGTGETPFASDHALYYLYQPLTRDIEVKYLKLVEDADGTHYEQLLDSSSQPYDQTVALPIQTGSDQTDTAHVLNLAQTGTVRVDGEDYILIPEVTGYYPASANWYGTSPESLSKVPDARTLTNKTGGVYLDENTTPPMRLRKSEAVYYIYYPNPRTVPVTFVAKDTSSDTLTVMGTADLALNVNAPDGLELTETNVENAANYAAGTTLPSLTGYTFSGVYVSDDAAADHFNDISAGDVTGKTLNNQLEGVTLNTGTDEESAGGRTFYAVYYKDPSEVIVHALVYNEGKLIELDDMLEGVDGLTKGSDSQYRMMLTSTPAEGTAVKPPAEVAYIQYEQDANGNPTTTVQSTSYYKALGISYGKSATMLNDTAPNLPDTLTLRNSANGPQVIKNSDAVYTFEDSDAVYYVFYPQPRPVTVHTVAALSDGSLIVLQPERTADVSEDTAYKIGSASGAGITPDANLKVGDNYYTLEYLAMGPSLDADSVIVYDNNGNPVVDTTAPEVHEDPDDPNSPLIEVYQMLDVIITREGDLTQTSAADGTIFLQNGVEKVRYADSEAGLNPGTPVDDSKRDVYLVYRPSTLKVEGWLYSNGDIDNATKIEDSEKEIQPSAASIAGWTDVTFEAANTMATADRLYGKVIVGSGADKAVVKRIQSVVDNNNNSVQWQYSTAAEGTDNWVDIDLDTPVKICYYSEPTPVPVYYMLRDSDGTLHEITAEMTGIDTDTLPATHMVNVPTSQGTAAAHGYRAGIADSDLTVPTKNSNPILLNNKPLDLMGFSILPATVTPGENEGDPETITPASSVTAADVHLYQWLGNGTEGVRYNASDAADDTTGEYYTDDYANGTALPANGAIYVIYRSTVKLSVNKTVTGEMGDQTYAFEFTLTGLQSGVEVPYTMQAGQETSDGVAYSDMTGTDASGTKTADSDGKITFTLKHLQQVILEVPAGQNLTLTENAPTGYTVTFDGAAKANNALAITSDADQTVAVVNDLPLVSPTGVHLTWAPYLLMLLLGIILLSLKGRFRGGQGSQMGRF